MKNYLLRGLSLSALVLSTGLGACAPRSTPTIKQEITIEATELEDKVSPTATLEPSISATPTPKPFSLDNNIILGILHSDYQKDIWMFNGTEYIELTNDQLKETAFSISQDGRYLAFAYHDTSRNSLLDILDLQTMERRNIVESDGFIHKTVFSQLNNHLAYLSSDGCTGDVPCGEDEELYHSDLHVINTITGEEIIAKTLGNFVNNSNWQWSPDEKNIAFQIYWPDEDIFIFNLETQDVEQLTNSDNREFIYGWTPDGTYLIIGDGLCPPTEHDFRVDMALLNVETGEISNLIEDGSRNLYSFYNELLNKQGYTDDTLNETIKSANELVSNLFNQYNLIEFFWADPILSPDGNYILFASREEPHLPGDFYVASLDGNMFLRLTNSVTYDAEGNVPKHSESSLWYYPDNSMNSDVEMVWVP